MTDLKWRSFLTPGIPTVSSDVPPGEKRRIWSPISSTLIYGERDAVLVDTFMTVDQSYSLVDWVRSSGKNLTHIYITHGHGDHFFNIGALLEEFPKAKPVATPGVVEHMKQHSSPDLLRNLWHARLPGQIPDELILADELTEPAIQLEGQELLPVLLGHTDTNDSTCLHVPSLGLVVAGDAVYNGVHLFLVESTPSKRKEWIDALDVIESLDPIAVIAGHKRPGNNDAPAIIEETRQYIRDFDRVVEQTDTAQELYDAMIQLHPNRMNRGALWGSARALKG